MVMKMHKHHIVPRHMGGSNDPSNIMCVTVEEHAEAHRILYEQFGKPEDKIAWQMLKGQISVQEAIILAGKAANTGRKLSKEHCKKISLGNIGKQSGNNHPMYGKTHTPEAILKISIKSRAALASGKPVGMMGKKHSEQTKLKMSETRRKKQGQI